MPIETFGNEYASGCEPISRFFRALRLLESYDFILSLGPQSIILDKTIDVAEHCRRKAVMLLSFQN